MERNGLTSTCPNAQSLFLLPFFVDLLEFPLAGVLPWRAGEDGWEQSHWIINQCGNSIGDKKKHDYQGVLQGERFQHLHYLPTFSSLLTTFDSLFVCFKRKCWLENKHFQVSSIVISCIICVKTILYGCNALSANGMCLYISAHISLTCVKRTC